jgi:hypothetical protein
MSSDGSLEKAIFDKTDASEWVNRPGTAGATFSLKGKQMHMKDYKTLGLLVLKEGGPMGGQDDDEGILRMGDEERVRANVRRLKQQMYKR